MYFSISSRIEYRIIFLTHHRATRISCGCFCFIICPPRFYRSFFAIKYSEQYLSTEVYLKMNLKTKLMVYHTVIDEVSVKFKTTREFIKKRLNELCLEHGISADEYTYIFLCLLCYIHGLATHIVYLRTQFRANPFVLKTVLF